MSFCSYAQNFEDVMLWRSLKNVEKGFYIDVGANDPDIDSVTKAFYLRGWRGINIEPVRSHWEDLLKERPEDINLRCAAGECLGEVDIWETDVRGWASASGAVIEKHKMDGRKGRLVTVPSEPLSEICKAHAPADIHFLKIDVEGFETSVIKGMDFAAFRPWIVVVEATEPNSTVESYMEWENLLLSSDYMFAYADGLNRFYIANERSELGEKFRYPPNVFDRFVLIGQVRAEREARRNAHQIKLVEERVSKLDKELKAIYSSRSWRMTWPLRKMAGLFKRIA